ncbi:MAG: asparaginase [Rubrivivax sp.]|nr:asparaginase [Rubrivivax sp.]
MQRASGVIVILGTGGTIAGTAASDQEHLDYRSAQIAVPALLAAVPALQGLPLETEQVAQIDSSDMSHAVWQSLAQRVAVHLARPEVQGVVVTHGTDTLEETAYFLHRVLAPAKPVVLTAAMRPATALGADGPQNLLDAVTVARSPGAQGVLAVMAGDVFQAADLRKAHTYRLAAFEAGDAGRLGRIEAGVLRRFRPWPHGDQGDQGEALGLACIATAPETWPRVEIVLNHAGADGRVVDGLLEQGLDGLVLAGTGNGTLSAALEAAALRAQEAGVRVVRASRCAWGAVLGEGHALPGAGRLSPVQARVELLLQCLAPDGALSRPR